ncbi:MAG: CDP-diacylglycerol--serine O-phosphatidyltransferase [bacterium]|nr:CDP-diacylglycerol--serine O-phosphatidyltransferase [bacterium]
MKNVQIIPNLFTTGNICSGFLAILFVFKGEITLACWLILVANLFDIFDGKIARITKSTSNFGVQFDSLSDLVSFGISPAILIYSLLLKYPHNRIVLVVVSLYVVCGALRLARFNAQTKGVGKKFFTGLPIPAAGSLISSFVLTVNHYNLIIPRLLLIISMIVLSYLMISTIVYNVSIFATISSKRSFSYLVTIVLGISLIALSPKIIIFIILFLFTLSGPLNLFYKASLAYSSKYLTFTKEIFRH